MDAIAKKPTTGTYESDICDTWVVVGGVWRLAADLKTTNLLDLET
jgi:hypothetical protein